MVLRIGHRGAKGHAPENTLRAFSKAVELGCDMTELDVHLCGSGELVVIHDETVDRTTDGSGTVANLTLAEIKRLDAGQGEQIPTLEEVLKLLRGKIMLNIELKGLDTAEPVYKLIQSSGWRCDDLLITSFEWDMLTQYKVHDPELRLGPLTYENLGEAIAYAETICAYCINPYHGHITSDYVEEAHAKGFRVYPWTVNSSEDIARATRLGVDGVISDYPDRVLHQ